MAANQFNRGIGIGFVLLFESQIFPFMLSSAFTARTIVQEKDQVAEVNEDVLIAVAFSIAFSLLMLHWLSIPMFCKVGVVVTVTFCNGM